MAPLLARWPLTRLAPARNASARTAPGPLRLDLLLKNNPVLTVSALQAPEKVAELVAAWNPAAGMESGRERGGSDGGGWSWMPRPRGTVARAAGTAVDRAGTAVARSAAARAEAAERAARQAASGEQAAPPVHEVGDGIRWHGPIRLTPMLRADAGLPAPASGAGGYGGGGEPNRPFSGFAYVAEVERSRGKVPDGRYADELRRRYPQGMPTGAEAEAWSLVRGLAKRLRGVAHLPGSPAYVPHADLEPLVTEHDYRVYSHEMLPWIVLREILRPLAPELSREPLPDEGGYILRQRGMLEVRVRPTGIGAGTEISGGARSGARTGNANRGEERKSERKKESGEAGTRLPYAIRDRADEAWPHSVYEFCDMSRSDRVPEPTADPLWQVLRPVRPVRGAGTSAPDAPRAAAALIAEVTGGVLVDTDGFPVPIRALAPQ